MIGAAAAMAGVALICGVEPTITTLVQSVSPLDSSTVIVLLVPVAVLLQGNHSLLPGEKNRMFGWSWIPVPVTVTGPSNTRVYSPPPKFADDVRFVCGTLKRD